jgi:hypothetical protein
VPRVEPADDFAGFDDEFDASVFPAFDRDAFDGFDDLAMMRSFRI